MPAPDVPAAKRAGLAVDVDRLAVDGDGWLTPEDRYALKTHGVCPQGQPHHFMVRIRIPGGVLSTAQARGVARLARRQAEDWVHLTTRQDMELHWVRDRQVPEVLRAVAELGLTTGSACGHTMRNVMCSEDAGLGIDEPFDCLPDARLVSDALLGRAHELNTTMPSRINIAFGGSPRCRADALINDAGFVSVVVDGEPGYELWAGGSLGKAPSLAVRLSGFVPRAHVLAATEAIVDVFVAHGDFDHPAKGRMKFLVDRLGEARFRSLWDQAYAEACARPQPPVPPVEVVGEADRVAILAQRPPGGWSRGVRPQRQPGRALLTVDVPLGDTCGSELELLADLADHHAGGFLVLGRDQDVVLRDVPLDAVPAIRSALRPRGLHLAGEAHTASVRACAGSAVCAVGITRAPDLGRRLLAVPGLGRSSGLRVHVSGCPNSCAQHQAGDIGLAGAKVRLGGRTRDGYHLFVGADLAVGAVGEVIGRVAEDDVPAAVDALVGAWEALRHDGETLAATCRRVGLDALAAHLEASMADRWAAGPEPADEPTTVPREEHPVPVPIPDSYEEAAALAATKAAQVRRLPRYLLASAFAGAFVGVAVVLLLSVSAPLVDAGSPSAKLVQGSVFGVALTLVVFAGAELFTGNAMYMLQGLVARRTSVSDVAAVWAASLVGNLVGSVGFAALVHGGGSLAGPGAALVSTVAAGKAALTGPQLLWRSVLCNLLVCLALWMAGRTRSDVAKLVVLWWALLAFVASGFEHSVANMTLFSLAAFEGSATWAELVRNLAWTVPGNVLGGGVLIGLGYAWLGGATLRPAASGEPAGATVVEAPSPSLAD